MDRAFLLTAGRVALAAMTADDQPFFRAWLEEQPELRAMVDSPDIPTEAQQAAWFRRSQEPDRNIVSLFALPEEVLIGNGGYVGLDPEAGEGEFRITIGHPAYRGKGYGTEATRLLLRYAFEVLGLQRVRLRVLEANAAARRTYEKAGFTETGIDTEKGGIVMSMTKEEYAALPA